MPLATVSERLEQVTRVHTLLGGYRLRLTTMKMRVAAPPRREPNWRAIKDNTKLFTILDRLVYSLVIWLAVLDVHGTGLSDLLIGLTVDDTSFL